MFSTRKLLVSLFLSGIILVSIAAIADVNVSMEELTPAVRETVEKYSEGAVVKEIEIENEDGRKICEVEIMKDGKEIEFQVSMEGEFLGYENEENEEEKEVEEEERKIAIENVPEPVKIAIRDIAGEHEIKEIELERENGVDVYEAEYYIDGVEHSLECSANGEILELENAIEPSALPAAALNAIKKKYPAAVINQAEAVQVFFYELEISSNGKSWELVISPTGQIKDYDDEKDAEDDD